MAWGAKPPTRVRLCAKAAGLLEATSSSHRLLWISTSPKRRRRQFVWAKRLRVHISGFATQEPGSNVVVESQVHRGTFFLACCRSIQSNARASNRRRVAHPRSPPRPDFVQPALVSELRSRFKHARCVRPWGAEAEDVDSAVAPPVAGAVSAAEAAEAAAAASMRALPTPSPVRSHPHALFPSVRDGSIRTRDPHAEAKARYPRHQLLGFHTQIAAGARRTLVENKLSPPPADLATP